MYLFRRNENDRLKVLQRLKNKRSSGPDNISNVVLKTYAGAIAPFNSKLLIISFESEEYLDLLKNAKVIPLYKSRCCEDLINLKT